VILVRLSSASIIDSLSHPTIVRVTDNLYAAKFDLMKFTPAKRILDDALDTGQLQSGGQVIESSSGTFALALAILCSIYELRLTLVTGPLSTIVRWRLESLGARIHVVPAANGCRGGIQQARLGVLHQLLRDSPDAFWPRQYTNPLNLASYQHIGAWLSSCLPQVDTLVGSVGSGGSLFGLAQSLRVTSPKLRTVAIDHNRSVIFGAAPQRITRMCKDTYEQLLAMGAGIPMGNVQFDQCDAVHWIPVPLMVQQVHKFHAESGYLVGPSSGAALCVGQWEAEVNPASTVLTILPDHGVRYVDTMFNPAWVRQWSENMATIWASPVEIPSPRSVGPGWCMYNWNCRPFIEVVGVDPYLREAGYDPLPI